MCVHVRTGRETIKLSEKLQVSPNVDARTSSIFPTYTATKLFAFHFLKRRCSYVPLFR